MKLAEFLKEKSAEGYDLLATKLAYAAADSVEIHLGGPGDIKFYFPDGSTMEYDVIHGDVSSITV